MRFPRYARDDVMSSVIGVALSVLKLTSFRRSAAIEKSLYLFGNSWIGRNRQTFWCMEIISLSAVVLAG